jgi:predicted nucleic acid-binding protein
VILADTSIWVRHWRQGDRALAAWLGRGQVAVHPFIIGELALGTLHPRAAVLAGLRALHHVPVAEHDEVLGLIERERLWGGGIGWVDCHLLASARLERLRLWTADVALAKAARKIGVAFR